VNSRNLGWGIGIGCLLVGCGSEGAPDLRGDGGLIGQQLVASSVEPAGDNCEIGGIALASGVDANGNGVLEEEEVTSTEYVCNGLALGSGMKGILVDTRVLAQGDAHCPSGGVAISQGPDDNGNGELDASEVSGVAYACNGKATTCAFPTGWDATVGACTTRSNWSAADLSGANLSSTYLAGVNLAGAKLSNAKLMWSDLGGANLMGADLQGADLSNARMRGADLSNAVLDGANLTGVDLSRATLSGVSGTHLLGCPADLPDGWRCADLGTAGKTLLGPGSSLKGLDLTGANLSSAQLGGAQVAGLAGCPAQLPAGWQCLTLGPAGKTLVGPGASLVGLDLTGAVFVSITDLHNVSFRGSNLTGATFATNTNLRDASFDATNLTNVNLATAQLADVRGTNLVACPAMLPTGWSCTSLAGTGNTLVGPRADLSGVSFANANLSGIDLRNTNLRDVNFSGANLSSANLSGAELQGANLQGAVLTGANLSDASFGDANLSGATLTSANVDNAQFSDATFTGLAAPSVQNCPDSLPSGWRCLRNMLIGPTAQLSGVALNGSDLTNVRLTNANLSGANLSGANLSGVDASGMNATGANLSSANLQGTRLVGADLTNANMTSADASDADLRSAVLTGAILTGVDWGNAICPNGVKSSNNGNVCP
jgi:uncharacterized protein YjbI with pentapeptide repeats